MKLSQLRDLTFDNKCPLCGAELIDFKSLSLECKEKHFNRYGIRISYFKNKISLMYFCLNEPKDDLNYSDYFFVNFLNDILFVRIDDTFYDFPPSTDLNLETLAKDHRTYVKTLITFI